MPTQKPSIDRPQRVRDRDVRREVDRAIMPVPETWQSRGYGIASVVDERPRITTNLSPDQMNELELLVAQSGLTKAAFVRDLITDHLQEKKAGSGRAASETSQVIIRNPRHVIVYSQLIIGAVEDTLGYDPKRHHKQPPPALRIEDDNYLNDLRELVAELKRLNGLLEVRISSNLVAARTVRPSRPKDVDDAAITVRKHLNNFLQNYTGLLGKSAALLTTGTIAALLVHLGVPEGQIPSLIKSLIYR